MIQAIKAAEHRVFIETFIWKDDETGREFRNALNEAAGRGVKVFVIYDGFANLVVPSSFFRFHPDVSVYRFPVVRPSMFLKTLRSTGLDHRKLLIVDDRIGFYRSLLTDGVRILLYRNAMIHAKTATIDGSWSTVGTANIDRLSLTGNYEVNLEIHDQDFAADLQEIFTVDSRNCRELTLDEWQERHPLARFSETVLVPLRPFL